MVFLSGGSMRLITSIYEKEQLEYLKDSLDLALLESKEASLNYKNLDLDYAISFYMDNHMGIALSMDKIYQPKTIKEAEEFLKKYKDIVDYFYVTDLGVCNLAIKLGIENKIIFDPKTMITNSLDFSIYASYGFHALGISSEITLEDCNTIIHKCNKNSFYQVFGLRLMFYSKRHLISLYSKKNNEEYPKEDVYFREATRSDYFPGFENINGTVMYRSYYISLLKELSQMKDFTYGYLESYRVDNDTVKKVLDIYKNAIDGKNIDELISEFNSLNLNVEDGFTYKDSVYQKEELKL
jgi:putative protease